jgi:hypothetical protein
VTENTDGISSTAQLLVDALKPHTPFAEAIVRRQCERGGKSIASLTDDDFDAILPLIITAASTFVEPAVIAQLRLLGALHKK